MGEGWGVRFARLHMLDLLKTNTRAGRLRYAHSNAWQKAARLDDGRMGRLPGYSQLPVRSPHTVLRAGIADAPRYSTNMTHNPSTFKFLDRPAYFGVHAIGEVWATYLFEVAENLIGKHGWHSTLFPPLPSTDDFDNSVEEKAFYNISSITGKRHPAHGNTLAVQLIVDGMKLQPCRPSFVNARDAILQADKILTGGDNACLIWSAFSKRGLGPAARTVGSTPWGALAHPFPCVSPHRFLYRRRPSPGRLFAPIRLQVAQALSTGDSAASPNLDYLFLLSFGSGSSHLHAIPFPCSIAVYCNIFVATQRDLKARSLNLVAAP